MSADDDLSPILAALKEGVNVDTTEEEKARKAVLRKVFQISWISFLV